MTRYRALNAVVEGHLKRITYQDEYARRLVLPGTRWEIAAADPKVASGQPITIRGGARIVDLVNRFRRRRVHGGSLRATTKYPSGTW